MTIKTLTFDMPIRTAKALLAIAPKQDVRYYLNGIHVDTAKGRLVAIDGRMMLLAKFDAVMTADFPPTTIERDHMARAIKAAPKKAETIAVTLTHEIQDGSDDITRTVTLDGIAGKATDGRYPDYEKVIPTTTSGELAQFDMELLSTMNDAIRIVIGGHKYSCALAHNGTAAAVMTHDAIPDVAGIVMPMCGEPDNTCATLNAIMGRAVDAPQSE
jgi:DNA polymerase-3 subunit beta